MRGKSAQQGEAIGQHRRGSLAQLGRCTALTRPLSCPRQLLGKHNYLDELPSLDPALHKSSPRHVASADHAYITPNEAAQNARC